MQEVTLNDGNRIPVIGLGLYRTSDAGKAIHWALEAGYRHFDTAAFYGNEQEVGKALKNSGLRREDLFVTTKLWNDDHGFERAQAAFRKSLDKLGLGYVDLYLLHWPVAGLREESWKALEALHEEGLCRSIGVSNYMIHHLEEMEQYARITPAVNQVECSPFLNQFELRKYCKNNGIVFEAYSPLTKGQKLADPALVEIANRYGRSVAQILIRWCLQNEMVVIPKSSRKERIQENIAVFDFEIRSTDMEELNEMNKNHHTSWDPTDAP